MLGDREHDAIGAQQNKIAIIGAGYGYSSPGELSAAGVRQIVSAPQDFAEFLLWQKKNTQRYALGVLL